MKSLPEIIQANKLTMENWDALAAADADAPRPACPDCAQLKARVAELEAALDEQKRLVAAGITSMDCFARDRIAELESALAVAEKKLALIESSDIVRYWDNNVPGWRHRSDFYETMTAALNAAMEDEG